MLFSQYWVVVCIYIVHWNSYAVWSSNARLRWPLPPHEAKGRSDAHGGRVWCLGEFTFRLSTILPKCFEEVSKRKKIACGYPGEFIFSLIKLSPPPPPQVEHHFALFFFAQPKCFEEVLKWKKNSVGVFSESLSTIFGAFGEVLKWKKIVCVFSVNRWAPFSETSLGRNCRPSRLQRAHPDEIRSDQIRLDQNRSDQIRLDQIRSG